MEGNEMMMRASKKLAELHFEGISDIPRLRIYRKPSHHKQQCSVCKARLVKDEVIIKVVISAKRYGPTYNYFHVDCHLAMVLHSMFTLDEQLNNGG